MKIRFANRALGRLEVDEGDGGYPPGLVTQFRKRVQAIRAADDERTFYDLKSLHYEKLKGQRKHQRSMRLNKQYRLILEIEEEGAYRVACLVAIEDYH